MEEKIFEGLTYLIFPRFLKMVVDIYLSEEYNGVDYSWKGVIS